MRAPRIFCVWTALALCGVMVLGAMTWLTRGVLASEQERAEAESRADLEERTRLALWRIDAAGAAIVLGENRHPSADYKANADAFLSNNDASVKLHFEVRQFGKLTSPEGIARRKNFESLRKLLNTNPLPGNEWSLLTCAAVAGENAWQSVPKDAVLSKGNYANIRQQKGGPEARNDSGYQTNFNNAERAQRAKTVEDTVNNSAQVELNQTPDASPTEQLTDLATMRAVWVGGDLFLLRQLTAMVSDIAEKRVQGVWLDQDLLKQRLLAEVKDLLPASELTAILNSPADDPLALVSFPFHLQRNELPHAAASHPNGPLIVGWAAVLLALLTTSFLVHGVMRLSERRASFVSAVTHELRTPLTTFRLYSDMLESGAVKPEKRGDYLRVLSREADRLSHLVENVLSFSKIERGSARSVVRGTTLHDLLEPMREQLAARLATAGMDLEMDSASTVRVRVDSAAVEHILFNLIDNAAKYATSGEPPKVEITTLTNGRMVEIIVTDHGPGIPVSERGRIFRAFHKSAREAAESRPGVGLGLALSRRLAKSLGGGLECVDAEHGACFVLRLPIA